MDTRSQFASRFWAGCRNWFQKVSVGLVLALSAGLSPAQTGEIAANIYQKASPAVFVILLRDAKGSPVSFGSGFLIAKNTLVTNFHVIAGGSVFLSQGPVEHSYSR